jgi:TatD DNase family protein
MEYAYRYGDAGRLYLNVTNRCTNRCPFCVRNHARGLGGAVLWGGLEPDLQALEDAVRNCGALEDFDEFIWCGFGEPTYRLDLILEAADWLRSRGARIRLNTNGHACLIHGRDVLPELAAAVDAVSVSLNAPDFEKYRELCLPDPGSVPGDRAKAPEDFWKATLDFLARAPKHFKAVQASVVGFTLSAEEIEKAGALAHSLGIERFRVR